MGDAIIIIAVVAIAIIAAACLAYRSCAQSEDAGDRSGRSKVQYDAYVEMADGKTPAPPQVYSATDEAMYDTAAVGVTPGPRNSTTQLPRTNRLALQDAPKAAPLPGHMPRTQRLSLQQAKAATRQGMPSTVRLAAAPKAAPLPSSSGNIPRTERLALADAPKPAKLPSSSALPRASEDGEDV